MEYDLVPSGERNEAAVLKMALAGSEERERILTRRLDDALDAVKAHERENARLLRLLDCAQREMADVRKERQGWRAAAEEARRWATHNQVRPDEHDVIEAAADLERRLCGLWPDAATTMEAKP